MAMTVNMPQLGESVTEGTIARWLKQPGELVAKYESIAEVVTDKVNAEIPSPAEGSMGEHIAKRGRRGGRGPAHLHHRDRGAGAGQLRVAPGRRGAPAQSGRWVAERREQSAAAARRRGSRGQPEAAATSRPRPAQAQRPCAAGEGSRRAVSGAGAARAASQPEGGEATPAGARQAAQRQRHLPGQIRSTTSPRRCVPGARARGGSRPGAGHRPGGADLEEGRA